jgi:hypothetical protein
MSTTAIVIIAVVIIVLILVFAKRDEEGKIKDDSLDYSDNFLEELKKFEMKEIPNRKKGFTEKDVQDQLEKFFNKHFQTVHKEYALEGVNVKQIDFDLGKGRLGVEVKLAREIIHEASWDRAFGQLTKYAKKKYTDNNLVVLIAGTEEEKDSQKVKGFIKDVKEIGCINTYVTVNKEIAEVKEE